MNIISAYLPSIYFFLKKKGHHHITETNIHKIHIRLIKSNSLRRDLVVLALIILLLETVNFVVAIVLKIKFLKGGNQYHICKKKRFTRQCN